MSKNEKDYSDYISHVSNIAGGLYLLAGFIFTTITILLTQLPDPSSISSQLTLFLLASMLDLILFVAVVFMFVVLTLCKNVPRPTKRIKTVNSLLYLIFIMVGLSVVVMFILWNLIYLGLASGIIWALFITASLIFIWKPYQKHRKTASKSENQNL